jgi:hypothetical protein
MSKTCFEHPSVHFQEDLCMQFYGIFSMHPYKQSGRRLDKTGCTSLPDDKHLDVRNMSKILQFN